jgi:hypothetical protein
MSRAAMSITVSTSFVAEKLIATRQAGCPGRKEMTLGISAVALAG